MAPIHVDEATGSDETGKGTPEAPYQSLAFALYTHPDGAFQIRKDASTPYDEPTQSALKKAKKGADGIEKKKKKAEELAQREAKEKADARERKEKKLEESKKIVLQEDSSLPKATKVRTDNPCRLVCAIENPLWGRCRRRSPTLPPSAHNVSAHLDGYIGFGTRRRSFSSSSATVPATSSACYLDRSHRPTKLSPSHSSRQSKSLARSRSFRRVRPLLVDMSWLWITGKYSVRHRAEMRRLPTA